MPGTSARILSVVAVTTCIVVGQATPPQKVETAPVKAVRLNVSATGTPVVQQSTVVGRDSALYTFTGRKGQKLSVLLKSSSTSLYFNVLRAGSPEAIYASDREASGNSGSVTLPEDGEYQIDVYLFRNAARRGAKASFTLSVSLK